METKIYAQVSVNSSGGKSLFAGDEINEGNVKNYKSSKRLIKKATQKLESLGFEVFGNNGITISIAGEKTLFESVFATSLSLKEKEVTTSDETTKVAFWDSPEHLPVGFIETASSPLADVVEGIAISEPPIYFESAFAPTKSYWHLRVPGDVSMGMNADKAHRAGFTGKNIRVVMVDTGWYEHPYFGNRGYRYLPTALGPGATLPLQDQVGHGTAESANLFAVAPDITFRMVKQGSDPVGDFNAAVALNPHIISCSWGYDIGNGPLSPYLQSLASAVANAVNLGITVVFSAGNGHAGFPAQHPSVIAAGGVYMHPDGTTLEASNYSSGFMSNIYPGRVVPDACGLVGMKPRAAYIMLPLQPNDQIDNGLAAAGAHPNSDETAPNDGWAAISGTSAAAPQIAGVCAILKQRKMALTPANIKTLLKSTAIDVTIGISNSTTVAPAGSPATVGPDRATGNGLVNTFAALNAVI
jgi:subtilase family serine protease